MSSGQGSGRRNDLPPRGGEETDRYTPSREAPRGFPSASRRGSEGLPAPRRNYALAIVIALVVFAVLFGVRVFWGMGDRHPTPSELLPQAPAGQQTPTPPTSQPAAFVAATSAFAPALK